MYLNVYIFINIYFFIVNYYYKKYNIKNKNIYIYKN